MKKSHILVAGIVVVALIAIWLGLRAWVLPTRIAFVHYQITSLGEMAKANDNSFIKIIELPVEEIDRIGSFGMVFINGMGLRITEDQRAIIQKAASRGTPIFSSAVTNPANNINSLDSIQADSIMKYLSNGGRRNLRSMLNYVRKDIDGKLVSVRDPEPLVKRSNDLMYHPNLENPDDEDLGFNTLQEYHAYLSKQGLLKEGAPVIILTGQMGEPTDLIKKLEEKGNVVYPVRSIGTFIRSGMADSIPLSAVIYLAHGRLGDSMVDYLTKRNVPMFSPLNVNRLVDEWEADKMGMSGGFLSQSVVTPEIDGALRPFALFGHNKDDEGLQHAYTIPERLETFVETVDNYIELQRKPNKEKRIAIFYFGGASGMETIPSLYNVLVRLKQEGYDVSGLPASVQELDALIKERGTVFATYAEGDIAKFMANGHPELVSKAQYEEWVSKAIRPEKYAEVVSLFGEYPGEYMVTADSCLGVSRLQFGNVVLLPQNAAGGGSNAFKIQHGTSVAPPHSYIAPYLWARFGFQADALVHFGTHGSLEFTPSKQVALCSNDWPDRLVGPLPHFYVYSIGNVGEGVIAKRRSYAGLQSYLTPPFLESNVRGIYRDLSEKIKIYNDKVATYTNAEGKLDNSLKAQAELRRASLAVKEATVKMGMHRELELDSVLTEPYTEEDILRVENFAEELATEKITGQMYTVGVPYEEARITSSVFAMTTEPIAYSLLALDKLRGRADGETLKHKSLFTRRYLEPARALVTRLLANPALATDELICNTAHITPAELAQARAIEQQRNAPSGMMAMMSMMAAPASGRPEGVSSAQAASRRGANMPPHGNMHGAKREYSKEEINFALAVMEVERTIKNVGNYRRELQQSPEKELASLVNAFNGGYTQPSPGGDPIANPNTLPTGRNLYSINAEATPSESAWEKGIQLANNTIDMYKHRHNDSIPRKVSYTLWSGEFIETEGATIAQILYMLGVEPIRDTFGRVTDLRLIPSKDLGRPRIDVVVQTSGQLRDIAASRLFLINRAVEMAAAATDDVYENEVANGIMEAERTLIEKGLTPKDAREISTFRVFGGVNGGYGTGIQGMVMSGDRWESEAEIADTYLNNMGAYYGSEKNWEAFKQFAFEAALTRTDAVIQPRQSNTWGALSLDHVYEFMGGLNLAVRNVTGKDPDAYLSDYRNRNNARMQEVKEAIGVESRTTIFNPTYIKEKMKGDAGSAGTFAEIVQNTYGWNVMKPNAIDDEMWDEIYEVYVKDKYDLGVQDFFEAKSPAALEEMTAVMMESARKGYWEASEAQLKDIAELHTDLVRRFGQQSGFSGNNAKLQDFIASNVGMQQAAEYRQKVTEMKEAVLSENVDAKGMKLQKSSVASEMEKDTNTLSGTWVVLVVLVVFVALLVVLRKKRKGQEEK
ncbi:cobaltochelatase subunit CobN [Phocaeicola coprophilus]|nr:cobaltochelatase subunit CobN [Phocaeicola coprophilus]